ncbi:hypothetical protein MUG78_17135 [Gordonia alkaliphila]|uniref:hypothetical protein n=1 Tax=Gordonia alkaliphila TaxID=1053547 RepID=UPI001FF2546E|nr:hypothetical protein [Gordonia alkaliphila]MCK0441126.1 hypothetical protein [Gordonia alkaliphila]
MSNTETETDVDIVSGGDSVDAVAGAPEVVADPMDMAKFFIQAAESLTAPRKKLDEAAAHSEQVRLEGEQRIQDVTAEVAKAHNVALDAEEAERVAYNAALDEILGQQIITKQALAKMGFKTAPGRKGRRPGK